MTLARHTIESSLHLGCRIQDASRLEIELLLSDVLQVSRSYLYAHLDQAMTTCVFEKFTKVLQRYQEGEPVAYLLGVKEFWSLEFEVNQDTLIPRPETELLVELMLDKLPKEENCIVADLGVGCGAVAVALGFERPKWQICGVDISVKTLAVAARNIQKYKLNNIVLSQANWCHALPDNTFDGIVSNPPYLAENDPHLGSLVYEPRQALVSLAKGGLGALKEIIIQARRCLKKGGWLMVEHGYTQADAVRELFKGAEYGQIESYADLNHILRVSIGKRN